jgi:hypothetical protein
VGPACDLATPFLKLDFETKSFHMKNSSLQEKTPTSDANKAISRHNL